MRNIFIIFLIGFIFTGCVFRQSPYIKMEPYTKITSPYVHIITPGSYHQFPFETSGIHDNKTTIYFHRTIPNMMKQDINIRVWDLTKDSFENRLLDKELNDEFEEYFSNLPLTEWRMNNNMERGINYYKNYVDFIGGLKCGTNVESQNIADGIGSKKYWTFCPYYDKQGNLKLVGVDYRFYYTFDRTKFEGGDDPSLVRHRLQEIQLQFKKDMKEIFDSIEIYDMDRDRMQKEGLLYDEKYSLDKESKAKDKSMKCTFIKESDSWACVGRETDIECTKKRVERKWECTDKERE
ncbi:hypothetical protein [Sulfurimonas sp.]|uniref:hypothetical protein n=1 Tax=Sulfurimonas sp. TaxID=2022749 RepID=UPI002615F021|nr:hypothetical protein [Sulfurimonas sp.]MCW8896236.1 hypothetical protein [Sulfurimonas sp.]